MRDGEYWFMDARTGYDIIGDTLKEVVACANGNETWLIFERHVIQITPDRVSQHSREAWEAMQKEVA